MSEGVNQIFGLTLRLLLTPRELLKQQRSEIEKKLQVILPEQSEYFIEFCYRNIVLVRVGELLQYLQLDYLVPNILPVVEKEKNRISETVKVIQSVSAELEKQQRHFVMSKAFMHWPDMGHDIDLFLQNRTTDFDAWIVNQFKATPEKPTLTNKIAGKIGYDLPGASPVEIHHGRMGHFGEHTVYPELLISRRTKSEKLGFNTFIPSLEDQVVIHVLQRLYSHLYYRVSDIGSAISLLTHPELDDQLVINTCRQIGVLEGLKLHVVAVRSIAKKQAGHTVLLTKSLHDLVDGLTVDTIVRQWAVYLPRISVVARVYALRFFHDLMHARFDSVARTMIIPLVAALIATRRIFSRLFA